MFELEKININPEYEQLVKELLEEHEEEIKTLLDDASKRLGEGRTANVCFLGSNERICIKIFKKPDQISGTDFYLPPNQEKDFLERMDGLPTKVRVPRVYASFKDEENRHDFLMMETLPAVSVDDILKGRADLPENFDIGSFQNDLLGFVEKMHSERRVCHRDLHEGNIMIDRETFKPYVIDFGAAGEYWEAEPRERGPYHITKDGQDTRLTKDEDMVRKVTRLLATNLTKTNK